MGGNKWQTSLWLGIYYNFHIAWRHPIRRFHMPSTHVPISFFVSIFPVQMGWHFSPKTRYETASSTIRMQIFVMNIVEQSNHKEKLRRRITHTDSLVIVTVIKPLKFIKALRLQPKRILRPLLQEAERARASEIYVKFQTSCTTEICIDAKRIF